MERVVAGDTIIPSSDQTLALQSATESIIVSQEVTRRAVTKSPAAARVEGRARSNFGSRRRRKHRITDIDDLDSVRVIGPPTKKQSEVGRVVGKRVGQNGDGVDNEWHVRRVSWDEIKDHEIKS